MSVISSLSVAGVVAVALNGCGAPSPTPAPLVLPTITILQIDGFDPQNPDSDNGILGEAFIWKPDSDCGKRGYNSFSGDPLFQTGELVPDVCCSKRAWDAEHVEPDKYNVREFVVDFKDTDGMQFDCPVFQLNASQFVRGYGSCSNGVGSWTEMCPPQECLDGVVCPAYPIKTEYRANSYFERGDETTCNCDARTKLSRTGDGCYVGHTSVGYAYFYKIDSSSCVVPTPAPTPAPTDAPAPVTETVV